VPLIVSWPGRFPEGTRSDALVGLMDLVPTLLDAIGLPVPGHVQGRSLYKLLSGRADPGVHRSFVRSEYYDALRLPHASHANMIFDGRYKLVTYHGCSFGELYDLQTDPQEFQNLWGTPEAAEISQELMRRCFDDTALANDPGQPRVGRF